MSYAHPGSIQVQLGGIEAMIRQNIEQNDIEGLAKFVRLLKGTVSVYADDHPTLWQKVIAIPRFSWEKDSSVAFEDEMERRELCLKILRKENIFGYIGAPPIGSGEAILGAMGQREEDEEAEVDA